MNHLNGIKLFDRPVAFDSVVYSDASTLGYGGYIITARQELVCKGQWAVIMKRLRVPRGGS